MALYHTYRPQDFQSVIGQDHVTITLKNMIKRGWISHAYLFFGPRGTGKTSVARIFAKAINCESDDPPCNQCRSCQIFNRGSLDLIEIDAASTSGVDMVRQVIGDGAHFAPNDAKYKVYVIDEAHMLSKPANNALLKTIEEPPAHVIFILVTTEEHKILPTVLSRCQLHQFRRIQPQDIYDLLVKICKSEKIDYEERALRIIVSRVQGCARDAVSLLDQLAVYQEVTEEKVKEVLGLSDVQSYYNLAQGIVQKQPGMIMDSIYDALNQGADPGSFVDGTIDYFHSVYLNKCGCLEDAYWGNTKYLDLPLTPGQLARIIKVLAESKKDFAYIDPQTAIQMRMAGIVGEVSVTNIPSIPKTIPVEQKLDPMQDPVVVELLKLGGEVIFSKVS